LTGLQHPPTKNGAAWRGTAWLELGCDRHRESQRDFMRQRKYGVWGDRHRESQRDFMRQRKYGVWGDRHREIFLRWGYGSTNLLPEIGTVFLECQASIFGVYSKAYKFLMYRFPDISDGTYG